MVTPVQIVGKAVYRHPDYHNVLNGQNDGNFGETHSVNRAQGCVVVYCLTHYTTYTTDNSGSRTTGEEDWFTCCKEKNNGVIARRTCGNVELAHQGHYTIYTRYPNNHQQTDRLPWKFPREPVPHYTVLPDFR